MDRLATFTFATTVATGIALAACGGAVTTGEPGQDNGDDAGNYDAGSAAPMYGLPRADDGGGAQTMYGGPRWVDSGTDAASDAGADADGGSIGTMYGLPGDAG
jgi:hypothetical protein